MNWLIEHQQGFEFIELKNLFLFEKTIDNSIFINYLHH